MNAIQLLLKDHEEIKGYFKEFEEAGKASKKKQQIAQKAIQELQNHSRLEEQIFYPALMKKGSKEMKELILEGIEEHRIADFMMERLQGVTPEDETFDPKFKALTESVQHHLKEEEREIFPEAKKILADDMERISKQMEELEKQMEG